MKTQTIRVSAGKIKYGGIKCPCCADTSKREAKRYYSRLVRQAAAKAIRDEINAA